jgi:hypothetical protein
VASAYSQANRGRAVAAVLQAADKGTAIITSLIDGATDPRRYAHEGLLLLRASARPVLSPPKRRDRRR